MLVFNPGAPAQASTAATVAPRGFVLRGSTVGFIDNSKPNFSQLADAIAEVVKTRYGVASIIKHSKRAPTMGATEAVFADVVAHCDLVITGSGD
jgi:hypothetical protein